jgi:hypothetical protein
MTREDFDTTEDYLEHLEAENQRLKTAAVAGNALRLKVSDKGALSIYGFGRFPVTLYKSQMLRLLAHGAEIVAFIKANESALKDKSDAIIEAKAA